MKNVNKILLVFAVLAAVCLLISAVLFVNSGVVDVGTGEVNQEGIDELNEVAENIINIFSDKPVEIEIFGLKE